MLVSILHRITGTGLALAAAILVWWLLAAADGADAYAAFAGWASWQWALIVWVPLTWALFQHFFSGLRHLVLDIGAGYELRTNKRWAVATILLSLLFTAALWGWIIWGRGA